MIAGLLDRVLGPHRFEADSPWGILTAICALFGAVILSLAIAIGGLFVAALVFPDQMAGMRTCSVITGAKPTLECSAWLIGTTGAFAVVLTAAFLGMAYARKGSTPGNALLLRPSKLNWWQYLVLVAALIGVVFACGAVLTFVGGVSEQELEQGIDYLKVMVADGRWQMWLLLIGVVVIAGPVIEEVVFRGFIFAVLVKTPMGFIGAAAITSALWSLLHLNYTWHIMLVLFIFGCCLAYVVWRTGSLWPAIIAHGANNLMSAVLLALR